MITDTRDPVAAAIEAWPASLPVAEQDAPAFLERLAQQGYVLVNEKRLAAALRQVGLVSAGMAEVVGPDTLAADILAAIQEQAEARQPSDYCPVEGCDELPEDHYHPATALDVERLQAAMVKVGLGVPYHDADPIEREHAEAVAAAYAATDASDD